MRLRGIGNHEVDLFHFVWGEVPPFADGNIQADIHDTDALQLHDFIAEVFAHTADLSVESLGQDDVEYLRAELFDLAFVGHGPEYGDAVGHALDKLWVDGPVDCHHVFLFVVVFCAQDFVDDVPITGQENQSLAVFVESADGENPLGVLDVVDDVVAFGLDVRGADDANGLVECDIDVLLGWLGNQSAVDADFVARLDFGAHFGYLAVDGHAAFLDELVGSPSGTKADLTQVFIDSCSLGHGVGLIF